MDLWRAEQVGEELIAEHGLVGWRLRFDGAKRRAGMCRYGHHVISLSAPLTRLHDEAEVRETLLHEIAHALAGLGAGHGPEWQRVARTIGSSGDRCVSEDAGSDQLPRARARGVAAGGLRRRGGRLSRDCNHSARCCVLRP